MLLWIRRYCPMLVLFATAPGAAWAEYNSALALEANGVYFSNYKLAPADQEQSAAVFELVPGVNLNRSSRRSTTKLAYQGRAIKYYNDVIEPQASHYLDFDHAYTARNERFTLGLHARRSRVIAASEDVVPNDLLLSDEQASELTTVTASSSLKIIDMEALKGTISGSLGKQYQPGTLGDVAGLDDGLYKTKGVLIESRRASGGLAFSGSFTRKESESVLEDDSSLRVLYAKRRGVSPYYQWQHDAIVTRGNADDRQEYLSRKVGVEFQPSRRTSFDLAYGKTEFGRSWTLDMKKTHRASSLRISVEDEVAYSGFQQFDVASQTNQLEGVPVDGGSLVLLENDSVRVRRVIGEVLLRGRKHQISATVGGYKNRYIGSGLVQRYKQLGVGQLSRLSRVFSIQARAWYAEYHPSQFLPETRLYNASLKFMHALGRNAVVQVEGRHVARRSDGGVAPFDLDIFKLGFILRTL